MNILLKEQRSWLGDGIDGDCRNQWLKILIFNRRGWRTRSLKDLIEHNRVVSDLIAMMAQVLDEDTTKALTQTPTWTAYLDSRRAMEKTKADVEKFAEILKELAADERRLTQIA